MIIEGEGLFFQGRWDLTLKICGTSGSTQISVCGMHACSWGAVLARGAERGRDDHREGTAERAAGCGHHRDGD